jgi:hypothetical protein
LRWQIGHCGAVNEIDAQGLTPIVFTDHICNPTEQLINVQRKASRTFSSRPEKVGPFEIDYERERAIIRKGRHEFTYKELMDAARALKK